MRHHPLYKRILVPFDGSAPANRGVDEAARLAKMMGGQLRLLYVIDQAPLLKLDRKIEISIESLRHMREGGLAILYAAASRIQNQGLSVSTVLATNVTLRLADQVLENAKDWQADLLVLGTQSRQRIPRKLLGSDADEIIRAADIPILFVRGSLECALETPKVVPMLYEEHA